MDPSVLYCYGDPTTGIGVAGRRTAQALQRAGVALDQQDVETLDDGSRRVELQAEVRRRGYETVVFHEIPTALRFVRPLEPERFVAVVAWETDVAPASWRQELAGVRQVWVPCSWNRDALEHLGLDVPIHVVPHPVDARFLVGDDTTTDLRDDLSLHLPIDIDPDLSVVTTVSSWCERKAPVETVEAFCRAFGPDDPVVLVVKTNSYAWGIDTDPAAPAEFRGATWWELQRILARHRRPPRVLLAIERWSPDQMAALVARSTCFLSLTRAEGWGLGAFDAATMGVPVVITGRGGQLDYLGADYPGLVPFELVPARFPTMEAWFGSEMWAAPDVDAAAALLRAIVTDPAHPCRRRAAELAPVLRDRFAPHRVGADARRLLEQP